MFSKLTGKDKVFTHSHQPKSFWTLKADRQSQSGLRDKGLNVPPDEKRERCEVTQVSLRWREGKKALEVSRDPAVNCPGGQKFALHFPPCCPEGRAFKTLKVSRNFPPTLLSRSVQRGGPSKPERLHVTFQTPCGPEGRASSSFKV